MEISCNQLEELVTNHQEEVKRRRERLLFIQANSKNFSQEALQLRMEAAQGNLDSGERTLATITEQLVCSRRLAQL